MLHWKLGTSWMRFGVAATLLGVSSFQSNPLWAAPFSLSFDPSLFVLQPPSDPSTIPSSAYSYSPVLDVACSGGVCSFLGDRLTLAPQVLRVSRPTDEDPNAFFLTVSATFWLRFGHAPSSSTPFSSISLDLDVPAYYDTVVSGSGRPVVSLGGERLPPVTITWSSRPRSRG